MLGKRVFLSASLGMAIGFGMFGVPQGPAFAQEQAATGALEEIIVTARRRVENLQQVPVSIEAVMAEEMELRGIESVESLIAQMPNMFNVSFINPGDSLFSMRGIPNVGFFVDGIWQESSIMLMNRSTVELDRVELLRGPQGTLYGRDTTGGAIRLYTRGPAEEFGMRLTATAGSYDRTDITANIDVPLGENFFTKWTVTRAQRDGFLQSLFIDRAYGEIDDEYVRGDLLWTPTDRLDIRLILEDSKQGTSQTSASLAVIDPGIQGVVDPGLGFIVTPRQYYELAGFTWNNQSHVTGYPGGEVGERETKSNFNQAGHGLTVAADAWTLNIDYELTDNIGFTSLTGWREQSERRAVDLDASEFQLFHQTLMHRNDLVTQEFQFTGGGDRLSWVGGLFAYEHNFQDRTLRWTLNDLDLNMIFATPECQSWVPFIHGPMGIGPCISFPNNDVFRGGSEEGLAVFGEITIDLTDTLALTLGARTYEQDNAEWQETFTPTTPRRTDEEFLLLPGNYFQSGGQFNRNENSFDEDTYRFALTNQFNDNLMAYVGYSEGFNAGGVELVSFVDQNGVTHQLPFPFVPENLENYEIGVRSDWLDGRLRINATVFHTDWLNIQQNLQPVNPFTGNIEPVGVTQNIAEAEAEGAEIDITGQVTDNFRFNVGIGILDTAYTEIGPNVISVSLDDKFGMAPDLQYSLGGQWDFSTQNGGGITLRVDYNWTDDYIRTYAPDTQIGFTDPRFSDSEQEAFGLLNARVVYREPNGRWEVSAFGTNLTDEFYTSGGFAPEILALDHSDVGRPREAGLTLKVFFE